MMGQRFGYLFLVMVGLMLFLAACGGGAPEPESAVTEAPAEEEVATEPEPEPEPEPTETPLGVPATEEAEQAQMPTEAPESTEAPAPTEMPPEEEAAEEEEAPAEETDDAAATVLPLVTNTPAPSATSLPVVPSVVPVTPTPVLEERVVEVEWPTWMRFGESDSVRVSLIPSEEGYKPVAEFEEHKVEGQEVVVESRLGYELYGVARLHSSGFDLSPSEEQKKRITYGEKVTWDWIIAPQQSGQQRLALQLVLRWVPQAEEVGSVQESTIYDKRLTVEVGSFLGLTTRQVTAGGLVGLIFGSSLTLPLALYVLRPRRRPLFHAVTPNTSLVIEENPSIALSAEEESLLRALFHLYARLSLKAEFRSGYSGARIFLVLPIRPDGRADAFTIAKLGEANDIEQEFDNYETFVKHTLPPITARILDQPITLSSVKQHHLLRAANRFAQSSHDLAALRYTFIGEQGQMPTSLRQALLANANPERLERLFQTFGPSWWMQRRPYTFLLAQEYDRMLPSHYILELVSQQKTDYILDGKQPPTAQSFERDQLITLQNVAVVERRTDQGYLALRGETIPSNPPLRLRLYAPDSTALQQITNGNNITVRVTATRMQLLEQIVADFDLYGLPDPLLHVPTLFNEQIFGTQSPIHGDLNLENVLIGLGDFVWLIDFALTREGHPLYDFAHLQANIIAHVLAPRISTPTAYLDILRKNKHPLLTTLHTIASRCLFNPNQPREYELALFATCIGALKYRNLDDYQKHLLYLTAGYLAERLVK